MTTPNTSPTPDTIHTTARHLHTAYLHLKATKHDRGHTILARKQKPTFTSRPPGNQQAITLEEQLTRELRHTTRSLRHTIHTPPPTTLTTPTHITHWIITNSQAIAAYPAQATQLIDTMTEQQQHIDSYMHTHVGTTPQTQRMIDTPQPASTIIAQCAQVGRTVTSAQLRQWAVRGKITATKINGRDNGYFLKEILTMP